MTDALDDTAHRIADRGREALIARLRPAFAQAASAHADVLPLSDEQLEEMVQRAVARADGLQWRRALAAVASEELGIGLGEALGHPVVARAQELAGAPSYEESMAELAAARAGTADATGDGDAVVDVEEPVPAEGEPAADAVEPDLEAPPEEAAGTAPAPAPEVAYRIAAIHVSGIADLDAGETGLELRLSDVGLDIARGGAEVLGRLRWSEIRGLEVPSPRGVRRRRRQQTHLTIHTSEGDATFQIPSLTPDELRHDLAPLIEQHLPG